ncbi:MAG: hypothetical protein OFPII_04890 [Osedax symbiont Rs1]|nr:MAG: hypothetical protein OFPII_04890 [Osedax symbiont Rs1]
MSLILSVVFFCIIIVWKAEKFTLEHKTFPKASEVYNFKLTGSDRRAYVFISFLFFISISILIYFVIVEGVSKYISAINPLDFSGVGLLISFTANYLVRLNIYLVKNTIEGNYYSKIYKIKGIDADTKLKSMTLKFTNVIIVVLFALFVYLKST